jgi:hypothetical protein
MELDISQLLAELPIPPHDNLSLFDMTASQNTTPASEVLRIFNPDQDHDTEDVELRGKNVVIVPRPTYNSTANITKVLGYYRDGLSEATPENDSTDSEEYSSQVENFRNHDGIFNNGDVSQVEAIVHPVAKDVVANFVPPDEFFHVDTSRNLGRPSSDSSEGWIGTDSENIRTDLYVEPLPREPQITLSGSTFRNSNFSEAQEHDESQKTSDEEITLLGTILEIPDTPIVQDALESVHGLVEELTIPLKSSSSDKTNASQTTPNATAPVNQPERHSPRLLSATDLTSVDSPETQQAEGPMEALYKYYGNHEFVGMAKVGGQEELSALVSFIDRQPPHKQARYVNSHTPAEVQTKKAVKSPIYIKQESREVAKEKPNFVGKAEEPTIVMAERKVLSHSEKIRDLTTTTVATEVTTKKSGGMNRAGYSYDGFDFIDR